MIVDDLKNSSIYTKLHSKFSDAFDYLKENNFKKIEPGKYEIDGDNLYARVIDMKTKLKEEGSWESHKKYIDIHYLAEGIENFGYANIEQMNYCEYIEEKDTVTLIGKGDFFVMKEGSFAICYPHDVHMPEIAVYEPMRIKKIVIKVKFDF